MLFYFILTNFDFVFMFAFPNKMLFWYLSILLDNLLLQIFETIDDNSSPRLFGGNKLGLYWNTRNYFFL